jgi:hypothetical protein
MKEKGCDVEGVLLHVQSQLLCIYYIVFSLIFIREKEGRRRRRKKNLLKNVLPIRRFGSLKTGHQLMYFFVGWGPHHNLFSSSFAFSPSAFRMYFLGLY